MSINEAEIPRRGALAADTRRRIEDTAERLFRTMGYQKTAVADIARELGMSPANVYRFFASKSAINEAIAARMLGGVEEELWAIARSPEPPSDRLRSLLRTLQRRHLGLFFTERRLHDMVTAAMAEHWGVIERFIQGVTGAVRHVLMDGMATGEFARLDPDATANQVKQAVMVFVHPVLIAECVGKMMSEEDLSTQLDGMVSLLLRALRP
jgi:AcrR family transcriptional regulator